MYNINNKTEFGTYTNSFEAMTNMYNSMTHALASEISHATGFAKATPLSALNKISGPASMTRISKIAQISRDMDPAINLKETLKDNQDIAFTNPNMLVEDSGTGKLIKLTVENHHMIGGITKVVTDHIGIVTAEDRSHTMVLDGREIPPDIDIAAARAVYGFKNEDKFSLWARVVGGTDPQVVDSIEIMELLGQLYLDKLIDKSKRNSLRTFLFEKGVITKSGMSRSSKVEIIHKLAENGLLKEATFTSIQGHYTWYKELARIINNKNFYPFTTEFARNIISKGKIFGQKSIDILIDHLISLKDPNIDQNLRTDILNKIDVYCRKYNLFNFKNFLNNPVWVLFTEVRKIISRQEGNFLTFSQLGDMVFGYRIYHREILNDKYGFMRIQDIIDYSLENIQDANDITYIKGIAEAIGIFKADSGQTNTQGFFKFLSKKPSLKDVEINLVNNIRMKLSVINNWKNDIPTLTELESYFGIRLHSITSESEARQFTRVFTQDQITVMIKKLEKDLVPIDPAGCKEILDELNNYNPIERKNSIKNKYGNFANWKVVRAKTIYGDSSTIHPKIWNKKGFQDLVRGVLFQRQGGFITKENGKEIYNVFDGLSGEIISWKELTLTPHLDPITNEIILVATNEDDVEVGVVHHIDFNKENNILQNYLWISRKNHITIAGANLLRRYIAQGTLISLAFEYGYAPRTWSYEAQVKFNEVMKNKDRSFPSGNTIVIEDNEYNFLTLDNFLGKK